MIDTIKKHHILFWYLVTLIFTGMLLGLHFIWTDAGNYSISFTQLGPVFATLLFIYIYKDNNTLVRIKNGLHVRLSNIKWYLMTLVLPLLMTGTSAIILSVVFDYQYYPWSGNTTLHFICFIAIVLGSIGEEIGWRGYLLPTLCKRFNPFLSSIIVGCLWGFWHLNYANDIIFWLMFIVTTVELSIIFTFFLLNSNGDLWTSIIFHSFFNLANQVFVWERFNISLLLIEIVVFGIICVAAIIINKDKMFCKAT